MFLNYILYWTILCKISLIIAKSKLLCDRYLNQICVVCPAVKADVTKCQKITDNMKIIVDDGNHTRIDYDQYVNSHVRIIRVKNKVTYYTCYNKAEPYFHVDSYTYFPLAQKTTYVKKRPTIAYQQLQTRYQKCLDNHCLKKPYSIFKCTGLGMVDLNFTYTSNVTNDCLRGITYVNTDVKTMSQIYLDQLFHETYNLIYLKIQIDHLDHLNCNDFETLQNLRELHLNFNKSEKQDLNCIFLYNPNLVIIFYNSQMIFNKCDKFDRQMDIDNDDYNLHSHFDPEDNRFLFFTFLIMISSMVTIITIFRNDAIRFKIKSDYYRGLRDGHEIAV